MDGNSSDDVINVTDACNSGNTCRSGQDRYRMGRKGKGDRNRESGNCDDSSYDVAYTSPDAGNTRDETYDENARFKTNPGNTNMFHESNDGNSTGFDGITNNEVGKTRSDFIASRSNGGNTQSGGDFTRSDGGNSQSDSNFTRYDGGNAQSSGNFTRSDGGNITHSDDVITEATHSYADNSAIDLTDSAIGSSLQTTSSFIKRTDTTLASCSTPITPSCSHDVKNTEKHEKRKSNKTKNVPNIPQLPSKVTNAASNVARNIYLPTDFMKTDGPINVIASIKTAEIPRLPNVAPNRATERNLASKSLGNVSKNQAGVNLASKSPGMILASKDLASKNQAGLSRASKSPTNVASTSVVSGIATVSGVELDRRQPPPVPARVFTCITEESVRKPKRKNYRPSPSQQGR